MGRKKIEMPRTLLHLKCHIALSLLKLSHRIFAFKILYDIFFVGNYAILQCILIVLHPPKPKFENLALTGILGVYMSSNGIS